MDLAPCLQGHRSQSRILHINILRSIEIEKGDTLWDIAGEYMDDTHYMSREDYLNEVMTINRMIEQSDLSPVIN